MRMLLSCSCLLLSACDSVPPSADDSVSLPTHGVLVGEVGEDRARVWARSDHESFLHVEIVDAVGAARIAHAAKRVGPDTDFAASLEFRGLAPGTTYRANAWFSRASSAPPELGSVGERAQFSTAPARDDPRPVRFAWSGDLAGQNACRDAARGFAIFPRIAERAPEFFVALGDMIYADCPCESVGLYKNAQIPGDFGPSATIEAYRAHWAYNRADPGLQALLARTPYFAVWDDHEVVNDFSPTEDTRDEPPYEPRQHLLPLGLRAFRESNALDDSGEGLLYRSVRWGKHLELFFLDNRRYRDPDRARDDGPLPKTQLGEAQLDWLEGSLNASDATWRIVISSVPIGIPTGSAEARDGWANTDSATGYERELALIFATLRARGQGNTIWLTTDVHFATGFEYTPFADTPDFHVREFVAGPLSAGIFPKQALDPTFHPRRLFFHGPTKTPESYDEALGFFNFGMLSVDAAGKLTVEIVDGRGATVASHVLER
ncbi:MAG TPA: alkaline phosphatase D family protein [Planctomycetota bacterium]|nr:alkaline phosphatase D family protein [Planctomycetota bacterium]